MKAGEESTHISVGGGHFKHYIIFVFVNNEVFINLKCFQMILNFSMFLQRGEIFYLNKR